MTTSTINTNTNTNKTFTETLVEYVNNAIRGTSAVITDIVNNKRITVAIKGYGISIGRQDDGSYGICIMYGEGSKTLTFKCIKDALVQFKAFVAKAWNEGKN